MLAVFLMCTTPVLSKQSPDKETVPESLRPWEPWVLHGEAEKFCPTIYNKGEAYRCIWPASLDLDLDQHSGRFTQTWLVFVKSWVTLPGGQKQWPLNVKLDGKTVPVMEKDGGPSMYMMPGEHRVEGTFVWEEMPEMLRVPNACGLVRLSVNQKTVDFPLLDSDGRLWLQKKGGREKDAHTEIRVFRLINDTIPMKMTTHLRINVSGPAREISVAGVLLDKFIPLDIRSPLPTRIAAEGTLLIQVRPGRWDIRVQSRSGGPVRKMKADDPAHGEEIWAFRSQNHLRMVAVEGVPAVDPAQTDIPDPWKQFPCYIVNSGDQMRLKEIRRGDSDPAPDRLHLKRTWWLDFDGKGFTIHDHVNGTISSQWYLAMNPPAELGRVSVDGQDRLITRHGKDGKPGVELRRGDLDLNAESRYESGTYTIPAIGWDHDFQSVAGALHLPPGFRLLTADGVDSIRPGTWFSQWTLLDLFLVLIIALAVYKLWNRNWGLIALITLGIVYHEPGAPKLVWLNILAAIALLRVLPRGWIRKLVNLWGLISLIVLLVLTVPFMLHQVRRGLHPQLEPHSYIDRTPRTQHAAHTQNLGKATRPSIALEEGTYTSKRMRSYDETSAIDREKSKAGPQQRILAAQDPNAVIQTGPGLPDWRWRSYGLHWNGPVEKSQKIRLWLLSPAINLFLAFARVILLAFLTVRVLNFRQWRFPEKTFTFSIVFLFMLLTPAMAVGDTSSTAYPPQELLKELKQRLLEKPDCLPHCADSPQLKLTVTPNTVEILVKIHAAVKTAVPLPGSPELWRPERVLLDGNTAAGLMRERDGTLLVLVPQGIHTATLTGPAPNENAFQILLPLKPQKVVVESDGWDVQGISDEGRVAGGIHLIRQKKADQKAPFSIHPAKTLPPFLHVTRVLSLGLNWQVYTTIRRISPTGTPVVISVPLIAGESVTTAGISVENGKVLINMGPNKKETSWDSTLKIKNIIKLSAPQGVPWTETWILDASPIWHCECAGIPVVHHQDQTGHWRPQWEPWPGEEVLLSVSRPKAVPGQSLTIKKTTLTFTPGRRFDKGVLSLDIRTSQGGQHKIGLPDEAKLQWITLDGKTQPIKIQENHVIVPLRPGERALEMEWHQNAGVGFLTRSPAVDVGDQAVNADVVFQMPKNRWILLTKGPTLGPAVRFWSYLVVILIAAGLLGRIHWTPLKTRHWLLLGLGLTQVPPWVAIIIVGWLLALGMRQRHAVSEGWFAFNLGQLLLVLWTLVALIGLYFAIQKGLLGIPDMQISGNGSSDFWLHWTQDRIKGFMPRPMVFSLPLFLFRILMLIWALWLAYSLLKWLRWGWRCFSEGGLWRKMRAKKKQDIETETV